MGIDDHRLVNELEAGFRLADRLDGIGPQVRRSIGAELDVDAEEIAAGAGNEQAANVIRSLLKAQGLKETLESVFQAKPAPTVVEVGATWSEESSTPNGMGSAKLTERRTLAEADAECATIVIEGAGEFVRDANAQQPVDMKPATIAGEAKWSVARGRLESLRHTLTVVATDDDPNREGGRLTQTVVNSTHIEEAR